MKSKIIKFAGFLAILLFLLIAILVVRTITADSVQPDVEAPEKIDLREGAVARLSQAIQIPTLSPVDYTPEQLTPFEELHDFLEASYPRVHAELEREIVGPCSLLYHWPGENEAARPAVLMSHLDVVPVDDEEAAHWTHPPFSGAVEDGFIWGRGSLDVKIGVLGILEAAEMLLEENIRPEHPFYFAFGCDEEIGGSRGAREIVALFEDRSIEPVYVLDEGLVITEGIMPGVDRPVALVGVAEKGFLTLHLQARSEGGHSSMPTDETAIGILSIAMNRLEKNPVPAFLNEPAEHMFTSLAPEMPASMRLVFSNLWFFEPLLVSHLTAKPQTNASVRTTTALTVFQAGNRDNVLPPRARASVNFRIAPGQTIEDIEQHVTSTIDDERIFISQSDAGFTSNPSPVSSIDNPAFEQIRRTTREIFGEETIVIPGLMVGGTDSRWFAEIADAIYRFIPSQLSAEDTRRIHGTDERIRIENYENMIRYYAQLMRNSQAQ